MKTIFFIFRLFSNPFKVINSMVFNKGGKRDNAIVKTLKLCLWLVLGIITTVTLVVVLAEDKENGIFLGSQQDDYTASVYGVEEEEQQELLPDNPDGTVNGLNLQLIDQISTDGYVKEYLTIAKDLQEGRIGKLNFYSTVLRVLGVAATEQGTYPGTVLLGSPLPTDSSGIPVWDKAKNLTLSLAYREDYEKYGYSQSFVRAGNLTGDYFSPWQVSISYYNDGLLSKSSLSKKSSFDYFHFRDQIYAYAQVRDWKYSGFIDTFGDVEVNENARDMYVSILYSGSPIYTYLSGDTPQEKLVSLEEAYNWIHTYLIEDYRPFLGNTDLTAGWVAKFVAIMLNVKNGGKISYKTYNYATNNPQRQKCQTMLDIWGINKTVEEFLSPAVDSGLPAPGLSDGVISGMMSNTINGKKFYMIPESIGHYIGEEALGPYYFAAMLKYAGINVDPTNPNSYMNTLPEGEWKPGGDSVWMTNEKVDMDKLTEDGEKVLNAGYKYLGIPYIYGGNDPNVGIDCSRFVQLVYKDAFGLDIPRATPGQVPYTTRIENKYQDAIPGDLVFYYEDSSMSPASSMHVAIFMGWDGDQPRIIHASQPGDVVKISTWDGRGTYSYWDIRRVPGFNGS